MRMRLLRGSGEAGDAAEEGASRGPEPELEAGVVPLVPRETAPRSWNLWELERIASEANGDEGTREQRVLLLTHMRPFANASGELPLEFDPLVRETFGPDLPSVAAPRR
jgi:hypothetical protein